MACKVDCEDGFEEGISWLPSHILDEAIWDGKECVKYPPQLQQHRGLPRLPLPLPSKGIQRRNGTRRFYGSNWAYGEQGMQVIFLEAGHKKSCGTGVFLPQRAGTNYQYNKKPACSPVLLPARVVQALKLNVQELRMEISRGRDCRNSSRGRQYNSCNSRITKDFPKQCWGLPHNENSSPELFLPKEWTY
ncbi:hypothetical protein K2173_003016 [Erythroxylum novogranatense]|uniref:Uncharacterized protein n=1 Tax=Erythroxylum novogranatense TaxID=1862640 RepID=A0AAV8S8J5_9ROSI|nr:hypothetical protein K2173_003016 [Erythroxylum novogranatense]